MALEIKWDKYNELIIRDIHKKWHQHIANTMLERFFKPNVFFEKLHFQDDEDVNDHYMKYLYHILNDECSIVVINEHTNEIYAIALVKRMTKEWQSWTALRVIVPSGKLSDIIKLRRHIIHQYQQENPDHVFDSLHLFEYYISDELKTDSEFILKFFNAICEVTRHMKMTRVTFLALRTEEQTHAELVNFVELSRVIYSIYLNKGKRPFAALREIDEMASVLYEKQLEPLEPYYEM